MAAIASDTLLYVLPDDIHQKILSSLTLKQRAIASLVSTKWLHLIASLDDRKFVQTHSTNRYCVCCYKHKLPFCRNCSILHPVIKLAADNTTLTEFYLFVPSSSPLFPFSTTIFESRLLTILHLKNCRIDDKNFKEFPCLKEVYFNHVCITPHTFSQFIHECPSIVELTLIDCCYLYSISVPPHLNQLKKVHLICGSRYRQTIEIKARNLWEFHLFSASSKALEVDLSTCTKLQVLKIDCANIPHRFPQEVCSAFPNLKSLSLRLCERLKEFRLLSPELENLTLSNLDDAIIVTPDLRSFKLIDTKKVPTSCQLVGSRLMEVE